jgi:hypothetical protein
MKLVEKSMFKKSRYSVSLIWMHYNAFLSVQIFWACFSPREKDWLRALFYDRTTMCSIWLLCLRVSEIWLLVKQVEKSMFKQKSRFSISLRWMRHNLSLPCTNFSARFPPKDAYCLRALFHVKLYYVKDGWIAFVSFVFLNMIRLKQAWKTLFKQKNPVFS